jgi:23S rRNA pseudouridine1911/1915/1917 synthase
MNNNIDTIDLEDELFEHFRFEVPKAKHPLINT